MSRTAPPATLAPKTALVLVELGAEEGVGETAAVGVEAAVDWAVEPGESLLIHELSLEAPTV